MVSRVDSDDVVSVFDEDEADIVEPPRDEEAEFTEEDIVPSPVINDELFASRLDSDELDSGVEVTSVDVFIVMEEPVTDSLDETDEPISLIELDTKLLAASFVSCSDEDNSDVALLVEEDDMVSSLSEEDVVEVSSPLVVDSDELASLVKASELPPPLDVVESNVVLLPSLGDPISPSELTVGLVDNKVVLISFVEDAIALFSTFNESALVTPPSLESSDLLERE